MDENKILTSVQTFQVAAKPAIEISRSEIQSQLDALSSVYNSCTVTSSTEIVVPGTTFSTYAYTVIVHCEGRTA